MRSDGRIVVHVPKELDPQRRAIYGPGGHKAWASVEQAAAWLEREIAERRSPTPTTARSAEPLGAYLARWFANRSVDWPERTVVAYRPHLRRWRGIADVPLGQLTRERVQGAVADLRRATWTRKRRDGTPTSEPRPYSRRTIDQARGVLHQALEDLIPDVLAYNPARARRRSRATAEPEQPVWSAEQAEAFLAVAERLDPRVALGFRLILRRALRIGECVALRWDDLDERGGVLRVDETAAARKSTEDGPTKTRRVRDVPLSADLVRRLREHRRAYPSTSPHVFTVQGERISVHYFRELWQRVVRAGRLPAINPKDGRATCATILLDEGWPLPRVAALLGHQNISTTSQFYARQIQRRMDQVAQLGEEIDARLDSAARRSLEGDRAEQV